MPPLHSGLQGLNIVSPGILGILTRITTNNTAELGNVCVLVLALSHAKYCNNGCIRQQSWLTHCVSPHYPGPVARDIVTMWAVCVTAWHGRDANCGNIIYSGHTLYRLQTPSHWTPLLKLIIWGRAVSLPLTLSSLLVTLMSITIVRYLEVMQRLGTRPRSLTTAMAMQWNANFIINIWNLGHSAHSLLPRRQQKLHRK